MDIKAFARIFNYIVLYYDKWRDALREVRYIEYYETDGSCYGVFKNEEGKKYEAYYKARHGVMSCDCEGYLLRKKPCKHIRFLALLSHTKLNLPMSYIRLGNFKLRIYREGESYEYIVAKGRIIGKKVI